LVNNNRRVSAAFAALADPTRRRILTRLSNGAETPVTGLAKPFRISAPAISRHLRVLESARLIHRRRQGREHLIRARVDGLKPAREWMSRIAAEWDYSFDTLDRLLQDQSGKEPKP
jgi:DNA-binding transcriptional ArsR family regulator